MVVRIYFLLLLLGGSLGAIAQDESQDKTQEKNDINQAVASYACEPKAVDRTSAFVKNRNASDEDTIENLKKFYFLFVTGITYHAPDKKKDFFEDYFGEIIDWMDHNNLSSDKIPTKPNHPPGENFSAIEASVNKAPNGKNIVFITHSKGALDIANYLTYLERTTVPEARPPIVGWIPLQAPFWGSYSSTESLKHWAKQIGATFDEFFQGASPDFAQMLSTPRALETYYNDYSNKIVFERVVNDPKYKILNVKAWVKNHETYFQESMKKKHRALENFGLTPNLKIIPSDGFSEFRSQNIPCMDYVVLENIDHWDLIWPDYKTGEEDLGKVLNIYRAIFKTWLSLP